MSHADNTHNLPLDSTGDPKSPAQAGVSQTGPASTSTGTPARRPRRLMPWLGGILAVLVVLSGLVWWFKPPELHGVLIQSPTQAQDFTLLSTTGEPLNLSDLRGKYVALFFGYTYCPDVCPTTLNDLTVMLDELGPRMADDVQVVMVSVDPERDTVEQLTTYLKHFDPSYIGLTGTVDEIQPIASQFGIYFEKHADTGLVDHTGAVTIIDREGYVRLVIPKGLDGPTGAEMAEDLRYLIRRG